MYHQFEDYSYSRILDWGKAEITYSAFNKNLKIDDKYMTFWSLHRTKQTNTEDYRMCDIIYFFNK